MASESRLGGQEQDPKKSKDPEGQKPKPGDTARQMGSEDEKVDRRRDADHPILPNPD